MKKRTKIFYCHAALLLVFMTAGCTDGNDEEPSHSPAGESSGINKAETASAAEKKNP
ncbi:hypothetical protein Bamy02_19160 [Bacillus amyloliquefaciens]|nr:hypothetical protein Bamy02_19160 [Bacillus amyloliquefaciens]